MSGQQIAMLQQGQQTPPQGNQPQFQTQGMPQFNPAQQSMPQQFAAMGGFPMPNPQAARWENRPANTMVPANVPGGANWGAPSTVSQLQALQNQVANMAKARAPKEVKRSRHSG